MNGNLELIKVGAYHESGHVVIGYLMGYSVEYMSLDPNDPGAGVSKMNYGEDLIIITSLLHPYDFFEIYNELPIDRKAQTPEIGDKIHKIFVAGSCSEAFYKNEILHIEDNVGEISGPDLECINMIQKSFIMLGIPFAESRHQKIFNIIYKNLYSVEIKKAIESLVKIVIQKDNYSLNQKEIEKVLDDCGYLNFIKDLNP